VRPTGAPLTTWAELGSTVSLADVYKMHEVLDFLEELDDLAAAQAEK
jgi:hypothetical protein